nr:prepilin-type N-terminal cleavage/methylation domain-containing protein [uncultured Romboutsia sp.]
MLKKKKNNKGFTLVELLVVIAIIGILAVVAVPALFKNIEKGKVADLESDISAIRSAVLSYYTNNSEYPIDNVTKTQGQTKSQVTKEEKPVILGEGQRTSENEGTQALLSELEGLSFPYGGSYTLTGADGTSIAKSPETLYLTITTKGASTTISEDGLKKLAQDLGLELVNQTVNVKTTTQTTGTPTSIFVKADTSAGQKIIIPLINK